MPCSSLTSTIGTTPTMTIHNRATQHDLGQASVRPLIKIPVSATSRSIRTVLRQPPQIMATDTKRLPSSDSVAATRSATAPPHQHASTYGLIDAKSC